LNQFASGEILQLLMNQLLRTFSFWWRHTLQERKSSGASFFRSAILQERLELQIMFILLFICSSKTFVRYNTWSMVLYTWTNVSNTICQFLIPCYHQNSLGFIVKHILFQQLFVSIGTIEFEITQIFHCLSPFSFHFIFLFFFLYTIFVCIFHALFFVL